MLVKRPVTPIYVDSEQVKEYPEGVPAPQGATAERMSEESSGKINSTGGENDLLTDSSEAQPTHTESKQPTESQEKSPEPQIVKESSPINQMRRENDQRTGFRKPPPPIPYNPPSESAENTTAEANEPQEAACDISFFDKLQHILMPLLLLAVALLGCSITKNIAVFYQTVRSMSVWEIVLFSLPMALFSGILVFVLYKTIILMFHLRTFTQISAKALRELRDREDLRRLCAKHEKEARKKLTELLKDDSPEQDKLFASFGEKKLMEMRSSKESLLDAHCTAGEWISKYVIEYQSKVDELAQSIISRYSWKAAAAATASPFAALDQIIVLATCVTMLKELFLLYNLRPTWDKNLLLMTRMVIHVYATGFWQDFSEAGAEALNKGLDTFISNVKNTNMEGVMVKAGSGVGNFIGGNLGHIVARGVGECIMHKITVGRLGAAAMRMLRPVGK